MLLKPDDLPIAAPMILSTDAAAAAAAAAVVSEVVAVAVAVAVAVEAAVVEVIVEAVWGEAADETQSVQFLNRKPMSPAPYAASLHPLVHHQQNVRYHCCIHYSVRYCYSDASVRLSILIVPVGDAISSIVLGIAY